MTRDEGAIAFAERVLSLLDQGAFTATYKYAVLLALMDLCMERVSAKGVPPQTLTTRELAEKVIDLYWPQTVPYSGLAEADLLRQNTRGQAEIVSLIRRFRASLDEDPLAPLPRAQRAAPQQCEHLVRNVEWKLIEMPLPRLQRFGTGEDRFVYDISWDEGIPLRQVRAYQKEAPDAFDNRILLRSGVAEYLIQLNGLLRPLVHREWAAMVARINRLEEARLERFLFRQERVPLEKVRPALLELQRGRCFYCGGPARRSAHVDHFIPWSRYPDDGLDNLVAADGRCNGKKRDFLASARHLERWCVRLAMLEDVATAIDWHRSASTTGVARAVYLSLPEQAPLWDRGDEFERADRDLLRGVLRACVEN